jgi:hypothetical protein
MELRVQSEPVAVAVAPDQGPKTRLNWTFKHYPGVTHTFHCFLPERTLFPDLPPEDVATATSSNTPATSSDAPAFPASKFQLLPPVMEIIDKE